MKVGWLLVGGGGMKVGWLLVRRNEERGSV